MIRFLIHMNQGTNLVPKIWVGDDSRGEIFFGSLGKTLVRKSVNGDVPNVVQRKLKDGYIHAMTLWDGTNIQAISDFFYATLIMGVNPEVAVNSFSHPEKGNLLSACKRLGVATFDATVQDAPEPPKPKQTLPCRLETASSDGAWSW